ncbi:acyl-CoA thioesterase [Aliikangiella sp. IMCC44653]
MQNRSVTFRFLAEPADINFGGKVHGGAVMKWIDQSAYACAAAWSGQYCVTVNVGGIQFYRPIRVGNLVQLNANIIYTGSSSIAVAVDVSAGNVKTQKLEATTQCVITFVAVDEFGNKTPVPQWTPSDEKDIKLQQYAIKLKQNSVALSHEFEGILIE